VSSQIVKDGEDLLAGVVPGYWMASWEGPDGVV
jgi:hypothetical protein